MSSLALGAALISEKRGGSTQVDAQPVTVHHQAQAFGLETQLWRRLGEEFSFPSEVLVYDTTNFFTYIQDPVRGALPRRGKNKAGKNDLNQVGLALVVSKVYGPPLLHQVYPGQQHDAPLFPQVLRELAERYVRLAQTQV